MDTISLTSTNTASAAVTTGGIKTPEAESETPSRIIQPIKPLPFTNGVLKRRHHTHHLSSPPSPAAFTYRECLKNHAATMGGHAVDGCGEFMPSPTSTPADPTSLKCAACGCHRNFHRRYPDESAHRPPPSSDVPPHHVIEYKPYHRHHPPPPPGVGGDGDGNSAPNSPSPPPISSSYFPSAPHMLLALSSGGLSGHPPENRQTAANPGSRKRFRTKFTADQKRRMREFAEGVGWRFQKRDEEAISEFCKQVGVERGVLKVWMHNNKATFGKSEINNNDIDAGTANGSHNNNGHSVDNAAADHHHHRRENPSHVVAANGCSSSS